MSRQSLVTSLEMERSTSPEISGSGSARDTRASAEFWFLSSPVPSWKLCVGLRFSCTSKSGLKIKASTSQISLYLRRD